ncbi:hypothetical protein AB0A73_21675 [Glycomyces sp. NPDC047369]
MASPQPPESKLRAWFTKSKVLAMSVAAVVVAALAAADQAFDLWDKAEARFADPPAQDGPLLYDASWPLIRGCDGATNVAVSAEEDGPETFGARPDREKLAKEPGSGAWVTGSLTVDLVGVDEHPVQISAIDYQVLNDDLASPAWVYEPHGGCGETYSRLFVLDLDGETLEDQGVVGAPLPEGTAPPGAAIGPAFTVTDLEPAQITVSVLGCEANYEWELIVSYFYEGESGEVRLGPYRTFGAADADTPVYTDDTEADGLVATGWLADSTGRCAL